MDDYTMLYCDRAACRVNTFEVLGGRDDCPGCGDTGEVVP